MAAPVRSHPGWAVAIIVVLIAAGLVALTGMRPEYDAYGWLVWGKQTLHWNLDTNGAPSWKPLTYLFTLPYALAGDAQPSLWMLTSVAVSLAGAVFAGRIAFRLTGTGSRFARIVAAVFAGIGVLGIDGYWHLLLISSSDPMVVTLCLAAIDCHLSGRPRLAFLMLLLASFGRPEAWVFAGLYAIWAWRAVPSMRWLAVLGLISIPLLWFGVPALTARSWFRAGDLALGSKHILHGSKITGVLGRFLRLYSWPMRIAAAFALVLAGVRRDRRWLLLAGTAALWIAIEIGFAFHGWSAVPRYLIEPAAVMVVLAGAGVGRVLADAPRASLVLRWSGPVGVGVLVAALVPTASARVRAAHSEIVNRRHAGTQIDRLHRAIREIGGPARIRACGQPVTVVGFQSTLAWELQMNVGNVGYKPGREIHRGRPIVLFKPYGLGWQVRPIHIAPAQRVACEALTLDTDVG